MQGKDELPLTLRTTLSTPPAPPNTPINHTLVEPQATTGPKLIRPEEMKYYANPTGSVFFKVPRELRPDNDELDSDFDLDFTI